MDFISFFKKVNASSVFDYLPDGLVLTDLGGKVLFSNAYAQKLMGLSDGDNIAEVLDVNLGMIESLIDNKVQSVFKITKDDGEAYVELSAAKIDDEAKFVITVRNVTQTHKFMKKMLVETESSKKVNRDKNSFLVKMANELKSPLHSIDGFSKALLEGLGGDITEKQNKYLNIINKNSHELLFLIDKVVEQSRLEAGLYDWNFKHLDVINLLQLVIRPYKDIIAEKSIDLTLDVEGVVKRTCFADEAALKTVFDTLMDLAVKSTYLGSIHIELFHPDLEFVAQQDIEVPETATEKSYLQFSITDSGSGMSETEKAFIFDPYYQLESGNKKNIAKSLALAIDKALIKNLRGKIWVESAAMQGSKFSFIIPAERLSV